MLISTIKLNDNVLMVNFDNTSLQVWELHIFLAKLEFLVKNYKIFWSKIINILSKIKVLMYLISNIMTDLKESFIL